MALTSSDLVTIDAAIASGAMRVQFSDGRSVTYHDMNGLLAARGLILQQIAAAEAATPVPRMVRVVHVRT